MTRSKTTEAGERTHISFKPIPEHTGGLICLSIYPPGQFINNEGFSVFVGGCGVGERESLPEAKSYLLQRAKKECLRRIEKANAKINHYTAQLINLDAKGLENEHTEAN